jgi:hypothetical protein
MRSLLLGLFLLSLAGCPSRPSSGACPESRGTRCLTRMICSRDVARGCLVCACEPALKNNADRSEQTGSELPAR